MPAPGRSLRQDMKTKTSEGIELDQAAEAEATLDPADWPAFRRLCHDMMDRALDHLEGIADKPVWQAPPAEAKQAIAEALPLEPQGAERAARDLLRWVLPYGTGNTHPRFFGWVHGAGTPGGVLAETMAAALNANLGGRDHIPVYVERQVIAWCRQIFGFPETGGGLIVSGTSLATLLGLAVARNHKADGNLRRDGVAAAARRMTAYTSAEGHGSIAKAMELLGLGSAALRRIPTDADHRMDLEALQQAVRDDIGAGRQPFCVIATAGSVNCGAIDDLAGISELCRKQDLWLHVDGAFGALAVLAPDLKDRLAGLEKADSLAFDFHKWMQVPYDAGCILFREAAPQQAAFAGRQAYLAAATRGLAGGEPWFCDLGIELSRGFRALKVWYTMKEHGLRRLGEVVTRNCAQARYLAEKVAAHPRLELMAPAALNIVCFRVLGPGLSEAALDQLNAEIVIGLQERGIAAPSTTRLSGRLAIRVNLTNHRTRLADLDILLDAVLAAGEARPGTGPEG